MTDAKKTVSESVAEFVALYGEEAVGTALNAYATHRQRSKDYAEKSKAQRAVVKEFINRAKTDPEVKAKLAELGISL
jgi:hypothetical protein